MELRFAQQARATKGLDLVLGGSRRERIERLARSLPLGFDEFTFRLKGQTREMKQADTVRVEVAIAYRTRAWQTIEVDLGPGGAEAMDLIAPAGRRPDRTRHSGHFANPLPELGRSGGAEAACMHRTVSAGRVRDILDILLIDTLGQLDYSETAIATRAVFAERATHTFPSEFIMPPHWAPELEALAVNLAFPLQCADVIDNRFRTLFLRLTEAISEPTSRAAPVIA